MAEVLKADERKRHDRRPVDQLASQVPRGHFPGVPASRSDCSLLCEENKSRGGARRRAPRNL